MQFYFYVAVSLSYKSGVSAAVKIKTKRLLKS